MSEVWSYLVTNGDDVLTALVQHIWLALLPVAIAFVLALPLGALVHRYGPVRHVALTAGSVIYTVPSLALLLLLPGLLGTSVLDPINVVIALTLYSLALLVRTTADGLDAVDPTVLQAASAMGYRPVRRWFTVQLPLAMPVILTGLRVATVANVSMVSVAALIGIGGLGQLFTRGFQLGFYLPPIVIGLVLSVALAVVADLLIVAVQRRLTPWARAGAR
ncbi:ABC transporter permease [Nocardioides albus]|uniref:Osmoprotectant transport system permease protein n=1 Tax=Nocardioides albus TaxID=1841 RepID=A0A7W5A1M8_9ACTN|nr:ABC transporter permease [Nocardioides albus]MBB3088018.1 osmoprotectant transport system permease protein [Nocardioides albus]GGU22024.1 glycine/betaine ABC transporter permease [Nocardioides albus]